MPPPRPLLHAALALYLDLHAHPELSGHEHRTAGLLAARLAELGLTVTRAVGGGHGLVGVLRNGPGPTLLLRTELDALPVTEATGLPYASTTPGVMHACGHDLHIAALTGAVALLAADRERGRRVRKGRGSCRFHFLFLGGGGCGCGGRVVGRRGGAGRAGGFQQ
ncbi:M20/M25/M40 family metallo-hydrolase, partial [Streptomyces sp. ZEA17I]|uniref:M20/M25/M40 family metallo-hydrolase n=1 Tax=Streptomyces sp. ZEA17I TaxID=2202516 RepID=UPI00215A510D